VTYSDSICYILMIVSMMKNAGFISLLYPFVVFGYALMEEINPKKRIWYLLMIYTQILIIIKFVFQLSYWEAFYSQL
jgi:piezo-type mechanosensitive ion channel component 1/2